MKKRGSHRWIVILIIVLVVAGGWRYWHKQLRHRLIPRRFGVVEQGQLYRSGKIHPELIRRVVEKNGIDVIVSLSGSYEPDEMVAEELGLELHQYRLHGDGTGDIRVYADAIENIVEATEQEKAVLVHCSAGTMRTGAAVAFYRMLIQGCRDSGAILEEMRKYDWKTKKTVLPEYVNRNMYTLARILKARGIIDETPEPIPQLECKGVRTYSFDELRMMDRAVSIEWVGGAEGESSGRTEAATERAAGRI